MRKIHAYRIDDGRCFPTHAEAKKAAQREYDDHMTKLRHDLTTFHGNIGVREGMACMAWIEQNFDLIAEAARLKCDADIVEDTTESDD